MADWPVTPALRTRDLPRLLAFYTGVVGCRIERGTAGEGHVSISYGPARLMLETVSDLYSPAYNAAIGERTGSHSSLSLYIESDELDALHERAVVAGCVIADALAAREWGQREFTVEDADGNWLTFWQSLAG